MKKEKPIICRICQKEIKAPETYWETYDCCSACIKKAAREIQQENIKETTLQTKINAINKRFDKRFNFCIDPREELEDKLLCTIESHHRAIKEFYSQEIEALMKTPQNPTLKEFVKWLEAEDRQNWEIGRYVEALMEGKSEKKNILGKCFGVDLYADTNDAKLLKEIRKYLNKHLAPKLKTDKEIKEEVNKLFRDN